MIELGKRLPRPRSYHGAEQSVEDRAGGRDCQDLVQHLFHCPIDLHVKRGFFNSLI